MVAYMQQQKNILITEGPSVKGCEKSTSTGCFLSKQEGLLPDYSLWGMLPVNAAPIWIRLSDSISSQKY